MTKHVDYQEVPLERFTGGGAEGAAIRWLIGEADGARNFAMRMIEIDPGGHSPLHSHDGEHEIFVWRGRGKLTVEGKAYPLEPGITALVPGNTEHQFLNSSEDEKLEFICVIPLTK